MPYPDGTPLAEEDARTARTWLKPGPYEGDFLDTFQSAVVDALRGVAYAVLAVYGELEAARRDRV